MFLFPQFKTRYLQSIPAKRRKNLTERRFTKFFRRSIFVKRSLVELFLQMYVYLCRMTVRICLTGWLKRSKCDFIQKSVKKIWKLKILEYLCKWFFIPCAL